MQHIAEIVADNINSAPIWKCGEYYFKCHKKEEIIDLIYEHCSSHPELFEIIRIMLIDLSQKHREVSKEYKEMRIALGINSIWSDVKKLCIENKDRIVEILHTYFHEVEDGICEGIILESKT